MSLVRRLAGQNDRKTNLALNPKQRRTWQPVPPPRVRKNQNEGVDPQEEQRVQHPKGPLPPVPLVVGLRYEQRHAQPKHVDRLQKDQIFPRFENQLFQL